MSVGVCLTLSSIFSLKERMKQAAADNSAGGVQTTYWFWGAAKRIAHAVDRKQQTSKREVPKGKVDNSKSACNYSPGKKYAEFVKQARQRIEADSASTNPVVTVAGTKKESFKIKSTSFRESAAGGGNTFRVALIEEGMGNMHDAFYYTREALESAVQVFNGLKSYADHPSLDEEETRPERSVRDIFGHFENLEISENDSGCAELHADLPTLPSAQWARDLMVRAVENAEKFPDTPFIGLSINANGDAEPTPIDDVIKMAPEGAKAKLAEAKANGIDTVKVVRLIKSAVSCDLVTEAGAGGKILNIIEGEKTDGKSKST